MPDVKVITDSLPQGAVLHGRSNDYKIVKTLGQGSFGITYLASVCIKGELGSLESGIKVAIKEFFMREVNDRSGTDVTSGSKGGLYGKYKQKFAKEAHNLGSLDHPNIIRVVESFEANNTIYYMMEYIDGGSLDNYIASKGRLDEAEALGMIRQIGDALSFMHSRHMLHLDLKPANIMMRKDGETVLIDFGLSKQYDDEGNPESSTTIGGGTPGYAPLEQAHYSEGDSKTFPVTMDVYALGATLFKMLTGKRPPEASVILNDHFPAEELEKCNVSERTVKCIECAMSPAVRTRYKSVDDFVVALLGESVKVDVSDDEGTVPDDLKDIVVKSGSKEGDAQKKPESGVESESVWKIRDGIVNLATVGVGVMSLIFMWVVFMLQADHDDFYYLALTLGVCSGLVASSILLLRNKKLGLYVAPCVPSLYCLCILLFTGWYTVIYFYMAGALTYLVLWLCYKIRKNGKSALSLLQPASPWIEKNGRKISLIMCGLYLAVQLTVPLFVQMSVKVADGKYSFDITEKFVGAQYGHGRQQLSLGYEYYLDGNWGRALYWYEKAAANNKRSAQFELGEFYRDGKGVEPNREKAIYWFKKAAYNDSDNHLPHLKEDARKALIEMGVEP